MFRNFRKAAQYLSREVQTVFSTPPPSETAHLDKVINFPSHTVRLGPVFAEGAFSYIHIATSLASPSPTTHFAVKRLAYPLDDPDARKHVDSEISFLSSLPAHPNIVTFYGAVKRDAAAFLLFELVDGGALPDVLCRIKNTSEQHLLSIFADIAAAIAHLHAQDPPVAMRDIKLENVLYDRLERRFKLCDFGSISTFAGRHLSRTDIVAAEEDVANSCTLMYRAPELVDLYTKRFICEKVDVWALGCLWYAMLYGSLPFDGLSSLQIMNGLEKLPDEPMYSEGATTMLKGMLTVSPAQRWDVFRVLEKVAELQGTQVNCDMRAAAERLRRRRRNDFVGEGEGDVLAIEEHIVQQELLPNVDSFAIAQTAVGANTAPGTESKRLIDLEGLASSTRQGKAAAGTGENWANFEYAFGASSTAKWEGLDGKTTEPFMQQEREKGVKHFLANFNGLHLGNKQEASARTKGKRNANDLIDFG